MNYEVKKVEDKGSVLFYIFCTFEIIRNTMSNVAEDLTTVIHNFGKCKKGCRVRAKQTNYMEYLEVFSPQGFFQHPLLFTSA
jgi:hypothetical protein